MRHSGPIITLLAAAVVTAPAVSSSVRAADPAPKLVAEHFMIDAIDPGIKLYVRNKRPEQLKQFTSEKTLLFVHGATQPAEATFDLPLEGLSWMDYIAQHGWDVYLVDVRGYGRSTRPPEMDQPAASNPVPSENHIRTYWWCRPDKIGMATMTPDRWTARPRGASLPNAKCVRA
jgi:pimeloyl-ACP methyl ester carboxylesterase